MELEITNMNVERVNYLLSTHYKIFLHNSIDVYFDRASPPDLKRSPIEWPYAMLTPRSSLWL